MDGIDEPERAPHGGSTHAVPALLGCPGWLDPSGCARAMPAGRSMKPLRIWLVGFGTVGRWVMRALNSERERLAGRYGIDVTVVGLANARDGFVYAGNGLDLRSALGLASERRSIAGQRGARWWPSTIEGLRATEADLLVEVTASPAGDGEPGVAHIREALGRGIPVVTSNTWPVALHGVELAELARSRGVAFRAESTVMSGTPVLSALVDGLAGAVPVGLRGLLNATANFILSRMAEGRSYEDALAEAQAAGLAERDPTADVDGHDSVAKVMILSALVFGRQLRREQVACRGITDIARSAMEQAAAGGARIKHVATLEFSEPDGAGSVTARVEPELVPGTDPLANIEGTSNAVVCRANPVGEVTIIGPGAGPQLAGQGVFSDLIAVARSHASD
jgi:homoserine dehydrogenase